MNQVKLGEELLSLAAKALESGLAPEEVVECLIATSVLYHYLAKPVPPDQMLEHFVHVCQSGYKTVLVSGERHQLDSISLPTAEQTP